MENAPGKRSRYTVTALAVAAVAAANALLWTMRPTADPVTPQVASAPAPGETAESDDHHALAPIPIDPRKPLDLELETGPAVDWLGRGDVLAALRDRPHLDLNLGRGDRTATPGLRLSNNLRLRGEIGTIDDPRTRDRDYAIGIGIDLSY